MRAIELSPPHVVHDVGGRAWDGRPQRGRLLRGGFVAPFTSADIEQLRAHAMVAVLDLRSDREAHKLEQELGAQPGVSYQRIPIGPEDSRPTPEQCSSLADLYVRHVAEHGPALMRAVEFVVAPHDGAVLVHCRTGRDRTGLVVALTLMLAQWDVESILAHHAEAAEAAAPIVARRRASWLAKGKDLEFFDSMNTGSVQALTQALDWITTRHNTVADYLLRHGLSDALPQQAVARLGVTNASSLAER